MIDNKKYLEEKWYTYFKKKYGISDDEMDEYIDSFNIINNGESITDISLYEFINDFSKDHWSMDECKKAIEFINSQISSKEKKTLDLNGYLAYIIPICMKFTVSKVEIKELFDTVDKDRDGMITCKELTDLIYKINKETDPNEMLNYKKKITEICKKIDVNGDGYLSYNEFKNFIINSDFIKK